MWGSCVQSSRYKRIQRFFLRRGGFPFKETQRYGYGGWYFGWVCLAARARVWFQQVGEVVMTNREIGRIGLSMAINYFTLKGYTISLPLNDTQWYDMVVEKDKHFYSVQCKATQTEDGTISLRSCGGTNGKEYDNIINHPELDYVFCVNKDLNCWLIPVKDIIKSGNINKINLRTELASTAHPKLDTTSYRVQISIEA